jgi:hypothetical protein
VSTQSTNYLHVGLLRGIGGRGILRILDKRWHGIEVKWSVARSLSEMVSKMASMESTFVEELSLALVVCFPLKYRHRLLVDL